MLLEALKDVADELEYLGYELATSLNAEATSEILILSAQLGRIVNSLPSQPETTDYGAKIPDLKH